MSKAMTVISVSKLAKLEDNSAKYIKLRRKIKALFKSLENDNGTDISSATE